MAQHQDNTESMEGIFIDVEVSAAIADDAEMAAKLEEVCPVDIFDVRESDGSVAITARTSTSASSATSASRRPRRAGSSSSPRPRHRAAPLGAA